MGECNEPNDSNKSCSTYMQFQLLKYWNMAIHSVLADDWDRVEINSWRFDLWTHFKWNERAFMWFVFIEIYLWSLHDLNKNCIFDKENVVVSDFIHYQYHKQ